MKRLSADKAHSSLGGFLPRTYISACVLSVNYLFPSSRSALHHFSINAAATEMPPWSEGKGDDGFALIGLMNEIGKVSWWLPNWKHQLSFAANSCFQSQRR